MTDYTPYCTFLEKQNQKYQYCTVAQEYLVIFFVVFVVLFFCRHLCYRYSEYQIIREGETGSRKNFSAYEEI